MALAKEEPREGSLAIRGAGGSDVQSISHLPLATYPDTRVRLYPGLRWANLFSGSCPFRVSNLYPGDSAFGE
jgi:hypothetical protein